METGSLPDIESSHYAFAFNQANFSDRILWIKILPDYKPDTDDSLLEWARNRKRRRDEQFAVANELAEQVEEQILNFNIPDLEGGVAYENQEEEAVAMIEESRMGAGAGITSNQSVEHEVPRVYETRSSADCQTVQIKTIHISSPILAAQSPFFYKLFSNGMKESEQRQVTLTLNASEEAAFMDMLNFMYSNTLPRNTPTALLQVLMAADKYEVASCMRYCIRLLRNLPMTCEAALLYLDLPSTVLMADTVQPLMDVAKQFLAVSFKDMTKFEDDLLNLPLAGIEAVLSSDNLEIPSEDAIYDFVLKWARKNYPKFEERREILNTRLLRCVRFPYMTCIKLKKVLLRGDTDDKLAAKFVIETLFYKLDPRYRQRFFLTDDANASSRRFVERSYTFRPVTVVEFESPRQERIVYFDLKRVECEQLFPTGGIYSQAFHLGGQRFILSGRCNMDQQCKCFGLFLGMPQKGSVSLTVNYEFSSRTKPSEDFVGKYKGSCTFTEGRTAVGFRNLFGVPWTTFIADDSPYFINGFLHLRAELTIKR